MPPIRKDQKNHDHDTSDGHPDASTGITVTNNNNDNNNDNDKNKKNPAEPSLWTRIQSSTSTLIQNTVSQPSGAALGADLAHVLNRSSHGKAGHSFPSSSSSPSSGLELGLSHSANESNPSSSSHSYAGNFRSSASLPTQGDLESFLHGAPGGYDEHDDDDDQLQHTGKGKGKQPHRTEAEPFNIIFDTYEMAWINATRLSNGLFPSSRSPSLSSSRETPTNPSNHQAHTTNNKNEHDGAAVVSLLSNPSFHPGLVDTTTTTTTTTDVSDWAWDDNDPADADGFPLAPLMAVLTADEKAILDSFRRLPSEPGLELEQARSGGRITSKSLVPDIDVFLGQMDCDNENESERAMLRKAVLSGLPGAEDWLRVEERYHDEVWGYLRPVMEDAVREVEEKKDSGDDDKDGPAVRRLKMVLRHMRGN